MIVIPDSRLEHRPRGSTSTPSYRLTFVRPNKRTNLTEPPAPFTLPGRFQNAALQVMRGR
jgi:hypothetical protein